MADQTPDQLAAANAILQQAQKGSQEAAQYSFPVSIQNASISINPSTLLRPVTLEGTAVLQGLDQLVMRTAMGEMLLKVQQMQNQDIANLLPARVFLQIRPGLQGLAAVLVVGGKTLMPEKPIESSASGSSMSAFSQTQTAEIPKIGKVHPALVLPSSLFSPHAPEKFIKTAAAKSHANIGMLNMNAPEIEAARKTPEIIKRPDAPPAGRQQQAAPTSAAAAPQATSIKILGILAPNSTPPAIPNSEVAIVLGNMPSGQPVLSVGGQMVAVQGAQNWPVNTRLLISMGPLAGLVVDRPPEVMDDGAWTGLRQALAAFAAQSPAAFAEFAQARLPQPKPAQLAGALLFFFEALKGNPVQWLGEDFVRRLRDLGKDDLVKTIQEQWKEHASRDCEGPGGPWRGLSVPLFEQDRMHLFRFYIYDPHERNGKPRDPNLARRFVIDVSLSRLGPVQLDGLVHRKKLDLVVRTDRPFAAGLRAELLTHFQRALEEVRYDGSLAFSANRMGWVTILDKARTTMGREV